MENLERIVKLTAGQYRTLANGGTVGDYHGLDDNYIYLVKSDSNDLPVINLTSDLTVGDIYDLPSKSAMIYDEENRALYEASYFYGDLDAQHHSVVSFYLKNNLGYYFVQEHIDYADDYTIQDILDGNEGSYISYVTSDAGTITLEDTKIIFRKSDESGDFTSFFGINANQFDRELLYLSDSYQDRALFANSKGYLIYSENDDYNVDFTFNTNQFRIVDSNDTNSVLAFDPETATISHTSGATTRDWEFPYDKSGVLALTSDIPGVIDVTNGVTADIKAQVTAKPSTILYYNGYYYVPQYDGSESGNTIPNYYNCFEGDSGEFHYLTINWDDLEVNHQSEGYVMEGTLSNYHAKDSSVIPTANGTLDIGSSSYKYKDLYLSGELNFASGYKIDYATNSTLTLHSGNNIFATNNFLPRTTNNYDLGNGTFTWRDLYLSGNITNGSNLITWGSNSELILGAPAGYPVRLRGATEPYYDNTYNLGQPTLRWKNAYVAGNLSDGTNSITVANIQEKVQVKRYI